MPDRNKAIKKLDGFPNVLWINLDRCTERRKYMEDHLSYWGIKDHHRISGIDGEEYEEYLKGTVPDQMNTGELACVMSHLSALKYFVEETDLDEVVIMEDDVDLSTALYWGFKWVDFMARVPYDWDVVQLAIICTGALHARIHKRFVNDFSTACYMITRHHAEKLVKFHCRGDKYKIDQGVKPRAVADDLIYNSGNTYSVPIFLYKIALGSSIHPEHVDVFHKASHDGLVAFWKSSGADWTIDNFMDFDPYLGRITQPVNQERESET